LPAGHDLILEPGELGQPGERPRHAAMVARTGAWSRLAVHSPAQPGNWPRCAVGKQAPSGATWLFAGRDGRGAWVGPLKRPGIGGGSQATGEWSCACTQEVSERAA
jgi:hypothetical protein